VEVPRSFWLEKDKTENLDNYRKQKATKQPRNSHRKKPQKTVIPVPKKRNGKIPESIKKPAHIRYEARETGTAKNMRQNEVYHLGRVIDRDH
jgi:hypothetical protein